MPRLLAVHAPVHATVRVPEAGEGRTPSKTRVRRTPLRGATQLVEWEGKSAAFFTFDTPARMRILITAVT